MVRIGTVLSSHMRVTARTVPTVPRKLLGRYLSFVFEFLSYLRFVDDQDVEGDLGVPDDDTESGA